MTPSCELVTPPRVCLGKYDNVYVDKLWNTPACQVIIICLTAKPNNAMPVLLAEKQSHNLLIGRFSHLINHRSCTLDLPSIANQ